MEVMGWRGWEEGMGACGTWSSLAAHGSDLLMWRVSSRPRVGLAIWCKSDWTSQIRMPTGRASQIQLVTGRNLPHVMSTVSPVGHRAEEVSKLQFCHERCYLRKKNFCNSAICAKNSLTSRFPGSTLWLFASLLGLLSSPSSSAKSRRLFFLCAWLTGQ